jgi:hypothetical protein
VKERELKRSTSHGCRDRIVQAHTVALVIAMEIEAHPPMILQRLREENVSSAENIDSLSFRYLLSAQEMWMF